jgi:hypothetical protein
MDNPTIRIDNVANYYMENAKTLWSEKDFPNVAPPFRKFSLEFSHPEYIVIDDKRYKHPFAFSKWKGSYETEYFEKGMKIENIELEEDGWLLTALITSSVNLSFTATVFCNKYGALTPIFDVWGKKISIKLGIIDDPQFNNQGFIDTCTAILQPQLLALSFMHCKNVSKEEVDPNKNMPSRVVRHWIKKGRPLLEKHYVLNIEPIKKVLSTEGNSEKVGIQNALHICRGHFKNYIEGKGLFGKYHGLFWWEDHIKGNQDQGKITKEYNVNIPES